ncbi:unnamed protein product [Orchesella dallaii]|uniref:Uncharacterized protein n=1 Tax=Orchesella dallaii TaxID=48710 RepID=A0ABP1Q3V0_9HEXA
MEIRVSSSSPAIAKPRGENGELTWDIKFSANLIRQSQGGQGSKDGSLKETAQQKYCSRLCAILRKLEGDDETFWNLCADLKWLPSQAEKMSVKLFGKLLGSFEEVCGDGIQMTLSFSCNTQPPRTAFSRTYRDDYCLNVFETDELDYPSFYEEPEEPIKSTFITKGMSIIVPSMMNTASGGISTEDFSKIVPFCEDTEVKISEHLKESLLREGSEKLTCSIEATISLNTKDGYINYDEIIMDKDKPCISKMIFQQRIHCDLSIVAANNAVLPCHKSYLAERESCSRSLKTIPKWEAAMEWCAVALSM